MKPEVVTGPHLEGAFGHTIIAEVFLTKLLSTKVQFAELVLACVVACSCVLS